MGGSTVGQNGFIPLKLAHDALDRCGLPVMLHVAERPPHPEEFAHLLRAGDVVTHCFTEWDMRLVDEDGALLVKAREALGDRLAAQDAQIAYFLAEPEAAAFAALRRKSQALSNWETVFERLLQASASRRHDEGPIGLPMLLLLAEGRESEALAGVARRRSPTYFDEMKFVAKYAVARISEGADLAGCKKLAELRRRVKRDKEEPYDWLRLVLRKPGALSQAEYGRLAADTYLRLIEFHLNSGKSSRAAPAAHYAAIVAEVSSLLEQASLWTDLLAYLQRHHGRKRLIWDRLTAEGCRLA